MPDNKTILLVDDEYIILESLRIQVGRIVPEDIYLEVAVSGEEAISLISELKESGENLLLVISDFNLDNMKGTDVLRHAKSMYNNSKISILSGMADSQYIQDFEKEYPLDAIFNKPWNFDGIANLIQSVIE